MFGKRETRVIEKLEEHLKLTGSLLELLKDLVRSAFEKDWRKVKEYMEEAHSIEHTADVVRREMEGVLYSGAFLPNFRADLLNLVESLDKITNIGETITHQFALEKIEIPPQLVDKFLRQVELGIETFKTLKDSILSIFEDLEKAAELVKEVELKEHEEDKLELELIEEIFSLDIDLARKLQLKQVVLNLGDISDLSEDCSDMVEIIVFKRRV
ncbi:MAG TPA: TIGR00153 family protein [Thermotogae bacterium]|nr:TIGR00153 family protein [Thermotogota bacterium]